MSSSPIPEKIISRNIIGLFKGIYKMVSAKKKKLVVRVKPKIKKG